MGIGIDGVATGANPAHGGSTVGGVQVKFDNNDLFSKEVALQIGEDERAHVTLLRTALGAAAVAKPNINLNALGIGFGNQNDFLAVARLLEDIGVTAYAGAASLLKTPDIIKTAGRLLAAEAQHAGGVRIQVAALKIPQPSLTSPTFSHRQRQTDATPFHQSKQRAAGNPNCRRSPLSRFRDEVGGHRRRLLSGDERQPYYDFAPATALNLYER